MNSLKNSQIPLISVCVPAFNRPEMLKQLICSFIKQDYANKELVISDDSTNNYVQKLVQNVNNAQIKYFKNEVNLGYSKNFLNSIQKALGDYVLILGDDDLLLQTYSLSKYVDAFNKNPKVSFIYSNQIQFSNDLHVEYCFRFFDKNTYCTKGKQAMLKIWTTSIFIPGIGIRKNFDPSAYYPKNDILFPQLEFIGHIINNNDALGICDFLIAGRAHDEQLGFYAIKDERIKGTERHGTVELFQIFRKLKDLYSFDFDETFLANDLLNRYFVTLLKEKSIVGNERMKLNYDNFRKTSIVARKSLRLRISFFTALITPSIFIRWMRSMVLALIRLTNRAAFRKFEYDLKEISKTNNGFHK